jgi:hypothetical protein
MINRGSWLSIIGYAGFRDISMSTARSFIKTGRVKSKLIHGRPHVFVNYEEYSNYSEERDRKYMAVKMELDNLRKTISKLIFEKSELQKIIDDHKD